jgi:hypothetical protein
LVEEEMACPRQKVKVALGHLHRGGAGGEEDELRPCLLLLI